MADTRQRNVNWKLNINSDGTVPHGDAELAVLMDIRDELRTIREQCVALVTVTRCSNIQRAFRNIEQINKRLAKKIKL